MAKKNLVKPRKRFCNEDCNNCDIPHNRQFSLLVNVMVDAFGEDEVYPIVQTLCPNMTCCADCHIDDFCHVRGCEIYKEARRLGKAWVSKSEKLRTALRKMVDWWDEGGLDEEDMDKMDAMIDEAKAILGDEPDNGKEQQ